MFFIPPKFFVVHPVSAGKVTFREFDIAYKYVEKRFEIEQRNKRLLREFPNLRLEPMPKIPRFTGDENENMQHIIDIVDQFYRLNRLSFITDDSDDENEENHVIADKNESGYGSDAIMAFDSSETIISNDSDVSLQGNPIMLTEEVEMTLVFTFDDICIHLVNNLECGDTLCESNHIFPSRQFVLNKLIDHTPEQINEAYELVLKSKILKRKYLEVFNGFIILRQD
ncbi:uncharacterized protein [Chironomus tepperi]|uniref:uncharacterized protein n=1 Tax=Chironomus tepperi TaxID=113505 RepID=UPI00391F41AC